MIMMKENRKQPFSFSFSPEMIKKLKYYKNTHPDCKLSQKVEEYLHAIIPDMD
jgi:hypothetical protein